MNQGQRKPKVDYDAMRPFAQWIKDSPPNPQLKLPHLDRYSGNSDALDHLQSFEGIMSLVSNHDDVLCKAFASTLTGAARSWFTDLERRSIDSFSKLKSKFLEYFATAGARKKRLSDLANMVQGKNETTMSFYNRFRDLADSIEERLTDREIIVCFTNGQRSDDLTYELSVREPLTKADLYHVAYATAIAEEKKKKLIAGERDRGRESKPPTSNPVLDVSGAGNKGKNRTRSTEVFTPLTKPISEIMNLVDLPNPKPLKENPKFPRDTTKYCAYHRDNGHETDNCWALKKMLQKWADQGKLNEFIVKKDKKRPRDEKEGDEEDRPPRARLIGVIWEEIPSNTKLKE